MKPLQLAPIDDEQNEDLARVAVADFVERRYEIPFDEVSRDYEGVTTQLGLTGNASSDYAAIKADRSMLDERAGRVAKRYNKHPLLKDLGNLFVRGVSDFYLGGVEGTANLYAEKTKAEQSAYNSAADKLAEKGGVWEKIGAKWRDLNDGFAALDPSGWVADTAGDARDFVEDNTFVRPDTEEGLPGQITRGFGQATGLPMYALGVGSVMTVGQIYQEGRDDYEQTQLANGLPVDEAEMHIAGVWNAPSAALEVLADKLVIGRILKPLQGKATVGDILKGGSASFASGGMSEGAQTFWQNTVAKYLAGYDEDRKLDAGVIDSIIVGGVVDAGMATGLSSSAAIYDKYLNPESSATPLDFKTLNFIATDETVALSVYQKTGSVELAEIAVRAKHGDPEAQKEYVERNTIDPAEDVVESAGLTEEEAALFGEDTSELPSEYYEGGEPADVETPIDFKKAALQEAFDFFQGRALEGSRIEMSDDVRTFEHDLNDMRDAGYSDAEIEAFAFKRIAAAGQNDGKDYSGLKPSQFKVFGKNLAEFKGKVFKDVSFIYKGGDPLTVIEEVNHGYFERTLAEGTHTLEDFIGWKNSVEEASGEVTHSNEHEDVKEWVAQQAQAWMAGKAMDAETAAKIPPTFLRFLEQVLEYMQHVMARAQLLRDMSENGDLDGDFETFLERSLGLDEAFLEEQHNKEPAANADGESLTAAVKRLGGLPRPDDVPRYRGELEHLYEGLGIDWRKLKKRPGFKLDEFRGLLNDEGFLFEYESDLFEALDDMARGIETYATADLETAEMRASFSMGGTTVTPDSNTQMFPTKDGGLIGPASYSLQAFHGTPHKVDKFSTEKIGTGEGAQAYGYGLYFAQNEEVAADYKKKLSDSGLLIDGVDNRGNGNPVWSHADIYHNDGFNTKAKLLKKLETARKSEAERDNKFIQDSDYAEVIDAVKSSIELERKESGTLYKVELNVEETELLDWDARIEDQAPMVRDALLKWRKEVGESFDVGSDAYKSVEFLARIHGIGENTPQQEASEMLASLGIKGIKYADGNSRQQNQTDSRLLALKEKHKGDEVAAVDEFMRSVYDTDKARDKMRKSLIENFPRPTSNFVIFNDADITITEENGNPVELPKPNASYSMAPDVDTPQFKKWFGDSKVVDENGKPLVVYHGTGELFDSFKYPPFFASSAVASTYSEERGWSTGTPNIIPVFLSLQNPATEAEIFAAARSVGLDVSEDQDASWWILSENQNVGATEVIKALKSKGYDGAFFDNDFDMHDATREVNSVMVFDSSQAKSATGNNGNFDGNDPRISYSMAPDVDEAKVKAAFKSAKKIMGETQDIQEAGYILPDGTLLDFSGKNQGGPSGSRGLDHRDIDYDGVPTEEQWSGMVEFLNFGAIRIDANSGLVSTDRIREITPQQKRRIRQLSDEASGLYLDMEDGGRRLSMEVLNPKKALGIMNRFIGGEDFEQSASYSMAPMEDSNESAPEPRPRTKEENKLAQALREFREASDSEKPKLKRKLKDLQVKAVESRKRQRLEASAMRKIEAEVNKRTEAIRRMAKERKDLTEAIKAMEKLVNNPRIPSVVRGRIRGYGYLAQRKTDAGKARYLEIMADRVDSEFNKYLLYEKKTSLRKFLSPYGTEYGPNLRKLSARVGMEARNKLRYATQLARNSEAPAPAGMTEAEAFALQSVFAGVLNYGSSADRVGAALKAAGEIAKGGRTELDEFHANRKDRNEARNVEVADAILNGEEVIDEGDLDTARANRGPVKKALDAVGAILFHPLNGLQQFLNLMDGTKGGPLDAEFNTQAIQAQQDEVSMSAESAKRTSDDIESIFGNDSRKTSAWLKSAESPVKTGIEWSEGGKRKPRTISKLQGVAMLMQWGDLSLVETFNQMGVDQDTINQVKKFIGPEGVKLASYLRARYAETGTMIQSAFKATEGFPMDLVDGYGGRIHRAGVATEADDAMFIFGGEGSRATVKSGSMKERVGSVAALKFRDALKEFTAHQREAAHYISHAQLAKDLMATFRGKRSDVRQAIRQRHGDDFMSSFDGLIDDIIAGSIKQRSAFDRHFNTARANITKASLGLKPAILIKQLTSAPAFIEEIGFAAYGKAFTKFAANPVKWIKVLLDTDYVKNRASTSQYADIQQELEMRGGLLRKVTLTDLLMMNVKLGDLGGVMSGGAAVYIHTYDAALAAGKSKAEAKQEAEKVFAASSERAQQSSAMHSRGSFLRGDGLMRGFFMYLTSPIQYQRNINVALMNLGQNVIDAKNGNKADVQKAAKQALRAVVVFHFILPQIFQAVASGLTALTSDDDEILDQFWARQKRALLLGNGNVFPLVGQIWALAANELTDADEFFQSSGSPLIDFANEVTRDAGKLFKDDADGGDLWKILEDAAALKGIPLETVTNYLESMEKVADGDTEFPIQRLLGWSDWALGETD